MCEGLRRRRIRYRGGVPSRGRRSHRLAAGLLRSSGGNGWDKGRTEARNLGDGIACHFCNDAGSGGRPGRRRIASEDRWLRGRWLPPLKLLRLGHVWSWLVILFYWLSWFPLAGLEMGYPHPRQFAWLSKQRSCRRGSLELIENKRDTRGQKGQNRKQRAERRRQEGQSRMQKAEGRKQKSERIEKLEAEGYREARRGWSREFTTHAIIYILFCQVLV